MENYPGEIDALKAELAARDVELGLKKNTINELTAKLADSEQRWAAEHSDAEGLRMWRDTVLRAAGVTQ